MNNLRKKIYLNSGMSQATSGEGGVGWPTIYKKHNPTEKTTQITEQINELTNYKI